MLLSGFEQTLALHANLSIIRLLPLTLFPLRFINDIVIHKFARISDELDG